MCQAIPVSVPSHYSPSWTCDYLLYHQHVRLWVMLVDLEQEADVVVAAVASIVWVQTWRQVYLGLALLAPVTLDDH